MLHKTPSSLLNELVKFQKTRPDKTEKSEEEGKTSPDVFHICAKQNWRWLCENMNLVKITSGNLYMAGVIDFSFLINSYIFMHTISKNSTTKPKSLKENHKFYPEKYFCFTGFTLWSLQFLWSFFFPLHSLSQWNWNVFFPWFLSIRLPWN